MKINRLLEITTLLLNKESITAKVLAERFGVSTRTIYRDVDVLSVAGVPVYTNQGSGGGISILNNYSLNKTLISKSESESIMLALKTLQATKYPEIDIMLEKIGAIFKNADADDWVHIDFSPWGSKPNEQNKFNDIKKAILERRVIAFNYINSDGKSGHRFIEPMRLVFKGHAWYLYGYCKARLDFRTFRISRMKNVAVTEEGFERRNPEDSRKSRKNEDEGSLKKLVNLKLKFYPQALYRLYDDFDDEMIIRNADGTCSVSITFPEDEWVYGYLLSYGCFIEVLEPEHVKKIITNKMRNALEFYENDNCNC